MCIPNKNPPHKQCMHVHHTIIIVTFVLSFFEGTHSYTKNISQPSAWLKMIFNGFVSAIKNIIFTKLQKEGLFFYAYIFFLLFETITLKNYALRSMSARVASISIFFSCQFSLLKQCIYDTLLAYTSTATVFCLSFVIYLFTSL